MLRTLFSGPTVEEQNTGRPGGRTHSQRVGLGRKDKRGKRKDTEATRRERKRYRERRGKTKHDHVCTERTWSGPGDGLAGLGDDRQ